jgi:hypothetical protein
VFWWGNLKERDNLEEPSIDEKYTIEMYLTEVGCGAWTVSSWLWIGTGSELLKTR